MFRAARLLEPAERAGVKRGVSCWAEWLDAVQFKAVLQQQWRHGFVGAALLGGSSGSGGALLIIVLVFALLFFFPKRSARSTRFLGA